MVVDSILQFMSQMDETVLALMDDYDDFYMIMKNNRGIHPIDLQKSIVSDFMSCHQIAHIS